MRRREGARAELPPGSGGASGTFASAAATWDTLVTFLAPNCSESKCLVTLNMERTMWDLMSASRSFTFLAIDWRAAKHSA